MQLVPIFIDPMKVIDISTNQQFSTWEKNSKFIPIGQLAKHELNHKIQCV
jgi:hypothetical protein